jgi:hypothetical protein
MTYRLGRLPEKKDARTIKFKNILNKKAIPDSFDVDSKYPSLVDNRMFMNDKYGCCVISGRAHQTLRFEEFEQKQLINILDEEVKNQYFSETGGADSGLVMVSSLNAWRKGWKVGDKTYNIFAYARINENDHEEVKACTYLLNGVYLALGVPQSAMDQWANSQTWEVIQNDGGIVGGHCVYMVAYNSIGPVVVTWGARKQMTWAFWDKYVDEVYGIIDNQNSWQEGSPVDVVALNKYLSDITGNVIEIKGTITFSGLVDHQIKDGELVTITIYQNDTEISKINSLTDSTGSYSALYSNVLGSYSAKAYIPADSTYKSATSELTNFDITLENREINLEVK